MQKVIAEIIFKLANTEVRNAGKTMRLGIR